MFKGGDNSNRHGPGGGAFSEKKNQKTQNFFFYNFSKEQFLVLGGKFLPKIYLKSFISGKNSEKKIF